MAVNTTAGRQNAQADAKINLGHGALSPTGGRGARHGGYLIGLIATAFLQF
jgi:hypothetical protein